MCNLGEGIYEKGMAKGVAKVIVRTAHLIDYNPPAKYHLELVLWTICLIIMGGYRFT